MFATSDVAQSLVYLDDTYLTELTSVVVDAGNADAGIVLRECLFHPQGGGQPADRGWVDDIEVRPVRDEAGVIRLDPAAPTADASRQVQLWSEGDAARVRVDRALRLRHAALHTAGHLIEAAGVRLGWQLAGNNHFPGQARIEFTPGSAPLPTHPADRDRDAARIREFVQQSIAAGTPVRASTDQTGHRMVAIGRLHNAPCGGTHVRDLSCLVGVRLEVKVRKGRIRVAYDAEHGPGE
ncbi:MAG: hypothetical protein ACK5MT_17960 [Actinomycetales bacterium]